ncbi:MAG: hypothetical protein KME54_04225 [Tolypothrix brevis GSE-NOS-MK-07-07A]|nr:hypothetical protein [Tolypothrix brevis GSE-NOS-MK-07-07A]
MPSRLFGMGLGMRYSTGVVFSPRRYANDHRVLGLWSCAIAEMPSISSFTEKIVLV